MRRWLVLSDSFKGTLSSRDICRIAQQLAPEFDGELLALPVADGGEGTTDCFATACGGTLVHETVCGPFPDERVRTTYALLPGGTAVIECASCAGLPLVAGRADPLRTTTYGVGELIGHAVAHGIKRVILGLGGSCTNDGGCGAAAALGARFYDAQGQEFVPVGGTLHRIAHIDLSPLHERLFGVEITVMCDVDNPLHGENGAAHIFAPQKGADTQTVKLLDKGLRTLDTVIARELGLCVAQLPGTGAAGGFGAGSVAFLGARLQSGIETVLDTIGFDALLPTCELVITGEGKLDTQSACGKVVHGVARRCAAAGVACVALVGALEADETALHALGLREARSINPPGTPYAAACAHAAEYYAATLRTLMRERGAESESLHQ